MDSSLLNQLIWNQINLRHKLGEGTGGSGHLGNVSASIEDVQELKSNKKELDLEVTYQYSIHVESEFTVYGENEPVADIYEHLLLIKNGQVVEDKYLRMIQNSMESMPISFLEGSIPEEEDEYWFERLDAAYAKEYGDEENKRAITYFHSKEVFPEYLLTPEDSFNKGNYPKSKWKNHLLTLEKWILKENVQHYYCMRLADPNWPGFQFAWNALLQLLSVSIPAIDHTISNVQNDPDLVEALNQLKQEITEREPQIKDSIAEFISNTLLKRNPQFPKRTIFINHFSPKSTEIGIYMYSVEFKVMGTNTDKNEPFGGLWDFLYDWKTGDVTLPNKDEA